MPQCRPTGPGFFAAALVRLAVAALTLTAGAEAGHTAQRVEERGTGTAQALAAPPLRAKAPVGNGDIAPDPSRWSQSEIDDAKRACQAIAAEVAAQFEILEPRRDGECGAPAPIRLEQVGAQTPVRLRPPPVVTCDVLKGLAKWIDASLQPLAERLLDTAVSEISVMSSYACRTRYGRPGARMSEHAFANALDIGGFELADGRAVRVLTDWGQTKRDLVAAHKLARAMIAPPIPARPDVAAPKAKVLKMAVATVTPAGDAGPPLPVRRPLRQAIGSKPNKKPARTAASSRRRSDAKARKKAGAKHSPPARRAARAKPVPPVATGAMRDKARFLRASHKAACGIFGTTLGPEANDAHRNHFHLDMFPRRNRGYCE